ncbi:MAG: hypothetical protein M1530_01795 [Candidatus Marsarchaeota archaeon]|nr:hypothetical protein [Candidatus Marsarchaeota archaeon]
MGPKTKNKPKAPEYTPAYKPTAYFSPFNPATLDRLEDALVKIKKEVGASPGLRPEVRQEVSRWIDTWLYGKVGLFSGTPWDTLQMNYPWGKQQPKEVRLDIPHSQEVGYIFQKYLQNVPGLSVEAQAPSSFGPLVNYLSFRLEPAQGPVIFAYNPFNEAMMKNLHDTFSPPQKLADYLPKSRVQMEKETQVAVGQMSERMKEKREQETLAAQKQKELEQSPNRYMQPESIAETVRSGMPGTMRYDAKSDTYTGSYVDATGQVSMRTVAASEVAMAGAPGFNFSVNSTAEWMARLLLPVDSIEHLILKYQRNDPDNPVGFWDWAWVVADVGLTVTEFKVLSKLGRISRNSEYFLEKDVRSSIDRQLEAQFIGDPAKQFAAKRYWRRKFLTQPKKLAAESADDFVQKAVKVGGEGGQRYATVAKKAQVVSSSRFGANIGEPVDLIISEGSVIGTKATVWQMTKSIALTSQATFMTTFSLYNIERAVELSVSRTLPDWVRAEHPDWKGQGLSDEEMRRLALTETRMSMAAIFGVFETLGLTSRGVQMLAPKLKLLINDGIRLSLEGKDPTMFFRKGTPAILREGGVQGVPDVLEKPLVTPMVKIVQTIAKASRTGGALIASTPGEMGVADTAFLTYWQLGAEKVEKIEHGLVQDAVVRKATVHVYAPYRSVAPLGAKGEPIASKALAEKENEKNLNLKFNHHSPEKAANSATSTAFLLDFVPNVLVINMDDPAIYARVTQGAGGKPPIPPQRFNRFVHLERSLGIVPSSDEEVVGDYKALERVLLQHYQPRALEALYSHYKQQGPLQLWLDVEGMASRWLADPASMERELPAGVRETFMKAWNERVLSAPGEMKSKLDKEDSRMMAAMGLVTSYVLWGYLQPPQSK